ncbi:MAG: hypothetical protein J5962_04400 [Lachnospiraceae bacterium]|nr:hypothetical protein [Lachnospiraceae bacterium]
MDMNGISDIDNIVTLLDQKVEAGVGRIKVQIDEDMGDGTVSERYHHGRCDVASPFATGCIPTFDDQQP